MFDNKFKQKKQHGFAIAQVLVAIGLMGALGGVSYMYNQNQKTGFEKNLVTTASTLLTQVSSHLTTEIANETISNLVVSTLSDTGKNTGVTDGVVTPLAGVTVYQDGFEIPTVSSAQKIDPWGTKILYCPYDNGNNIAGNNQNYAPSKMIQGDFNQSGASIVFSVISAGPDKIFQTTCANIKAGIRNGDDGFRVKNVNDIKQGVGGTKYYGDPVNSGSGAFNPATHPLASVTGYLGEIRADAGTGITYFFSNSADCGLTGDITVGSNCWRPVTPKGSVQGEGATCDQFGIGATATDASGNLLVCQPL